MKRNLFLLPVLSFAAFLLVNSCTKVSPKSTGEVIASTNGQLDQLTRPIVLMGLAKCYHVRTNELLWAEVQLLDAKGRFVTFRDNNGVAAMLILTDRTIGDTVFP